MQATEQEDELSRGLLRVFSVASGLEVKSLPEEVIRRWQAEATSGRYTIGTPALGNRMPLTLIVGAGRLLATATSAQDRAIVTELLQEAICEIVQ
jgi:hypothetical protein